MRCPAALRILLAAGITATVASGPPASAQTPSSASVPAEALFEEARSLVAAGKYAEACPKFADSERLGPSVATLLNLANCWEKAGRTATAWATYREAASAANAAGRKDYLATAQRRADGLAPKLARLTVTVAQPAPAQQVKRDGLLVDSAEWNLGIPVDTGTHIVEAGAPGRKPWSVAVEIAQDGAQTTVGVPLLEEAVAVPGAAASAPVVPETPPASPTSAAPLASNGPSGGNRQGLAGLIVGGVGVIGLGIGGVFALGAKSKYDDSLKNCEPSPNMNICSSVGLSQREDARSAGDRATIFVGVGAAAVVAGAIVWLTAPRSPAASSARLQVLPTLGGVVARGAW